MFKREFFEPCVDVQALSTLRQDDDVQFGETREACVDHRWLTFGGETQHLDQHATSHYVD